MQRQFFGTDGVRGPFGGPLINPDFASRLAFAAGRWILGRHSAGNTPVEVLVGRDTRASGPQLEQAIASGLAAAGCRVFSLGVLPTPAISRAMRLRNTPLGVVITASHNPAEDNGIKFFGPGGIKLCDEDELAIEALLPATPLLDSGRPESLGEAGESYVRDLSALLPASCLRGWTVVLDTANGATCRTSPAVLRALGAELITLGDQPDGLNINLKVGSEHPAALAEAVLRHKAMLGIAHDGDGDRCILCDENGSIVDGDEVLTLLALHALRRGKLGNRCLVVTVQSNLGVDRAVSEADGRVLRTQVGDRYVIEGMRQVGSNLGGESSGHVICSDVSPTGDGLVCVLKVIEVMLETGQPLSVLRKALKRFPQRSTAVRVREKKPLETLPTLRAEIAALEHELGDQGRLLIRYSGTEAKLRLLIEGPSDECVDSGLARLLSAVRKDLELL